MSMPPLNPMIALLVMSLVAAGALAFVRDYRWSTRLNILASSVAAVRVTALRQPPVDYLLLADDLNIVFIVLNAFVGFTTSDLQR